MMDNDSTTKRKNVVFLFGAGASIPAGCPSTDQLTDWLVNLSKTDEVVRDKFPWLSSAWEILRLYANGFVDQPDTVLPDGRIISRRLFKTNFEQFVNMLELMGGYANAITPGHMSKEFLQHVDAQQLPSREIGLAITTAALTRIHSETRENHPFNKLAQIR